MGTRRVEPEVHDMLPDYEPVGAMPIFVEGAVRVQELPCPDGSLVSFTVANIAKHMIKKDLRRRWLTIYSKDDDIYIGLTQPEVDAATAAFWPKATPLILRMNIDLWIRAAATQTLVTVISEQWTD